MESPNWFKINHFICIKWLAALLHLICYTSKNGPFKYLQKNRIYNAMSPEKSSPASQGGYIRSSTTFIKDVT